MEEQKQNIEQDYKPVPHEEVIEPKKKINWKEIVLLYTVIPIISSIVFSIWNLVDGHSARLILQVFFVSFFFPLFQFSSIFCSIFPGCGPDSTLESIIKIGFVIVTVLFIPIIFYLKKDRKKAFFIMVIILQLLNVLAIYSLR